VRGGVDRLERGSDLLVGDVGYEPHRRPAQLHGVGADYGARPDGVRVASGWQATPSQHTISASRIPRCIAR
jgi:hypothetical protein